MIADEVKIVDIEAQAVKQVIANSYGGLRLDVAGWRKSRRHGHGRASVRRAIQDLIENGEIVAEARGGIVCLEIAR
jgi:hypothetical protein